MVYLIFNEGWTSRNELSAQALALGRALAELMPDEAEVHGLVALMLLDRALALRGHGEYVVQAAIASLHIEQPRDWAQIAALYGELAALTGSPVVELNRAVAVAEAEGPQAGLAIVDTLPAEHYRYLHSTRAELLRRLGRTDEAREEYAKAIADFSDTPERRLLEQRMGDLP